MAKKFNDPSIATITVLNDADMMSTFNASTGELSKILVSDVKASVVPTFEETLQKQGSTPFTTDNTIDMDGHALSLIGELDAASIFVFNDNDFYIFLTREANGGGFSGQIQVNNDAGVSEPNEVYIKPDGVYIYNNNHFAAILHAANLTADRSIEFPDKSGTLAIVDIADDFINDAAAATGGIAVGGLYHTSGVVKIRLS